MGFCSLYIHTHTVLDQPYLFCSYPGVEGVPDLSEAVHQVGWREGPLGQVTCTFQFTENVLGSEPGEGLITGVTELHGCVQSELHLIYPTQ